MSNAAIEYMVYCGIAHFNSTILSPQGNEMW